MVHDEAHVCSAATTLWAVQKEDEIKNNRQFSSWHHFYHNCKNSFSLLSSGLFKHGFPIVVRLRITT